MRGLNQYVIPFAGMKNGVFHFNYEVDGRFFEHFPDSLVADCQIFVDLTFDKKDRLFVLNFDVSGTVASECDRCGGDFDLPIHGFHTLFVKVGEAPAEEAEEEDIMWIGEHDSELDLSAWIYEFIHLTLPFRKVHPDLPNGLPGCDEKILAKLAQPEDQDKGDPRWDKLRNLSKE